MTNLISLVASEPHYLHHLLPIWEQLPVSMKGDVILGQDVKAGAQHAAHVILVAGFADVKNNPTFPYIYVEHGAGQSYIGMDRSVVAYYSGGNAHQRCKMFLCPNSEVADRWLATYPDKPAVIVGCPRLDSWHAGLRGENEPRTVAVTFHWDAQFTGVPETTSAFGHYVQDMLDIVIGWKRQGYHVIGHNHPRYTGLAEFWQGPDMRPYVEYVSDGADVLSRASILVADNTSMQAEFLSLSRPVVWLNHPDYRRDVEHGGRFWTWPQRAGLQIDTPADLAQLGLNSVPAAQWHPYAFADGHAANRAAAAIVDLLD